MARRSGICLAGRPPNNWYHETTYQNILDKLTPARSRAPRWDPDSIMEYEFEAGLIDEPERTTSNGLVPPATLSATDKQWALNWYPVRRPADDSAPFQAVAVNLAAGQQVDFVIKPTSSSKYTIETKGASDTLLALFEDVGGEPRFLAGDDDSGEDRNASIRYKLFKGRTYHARLRLYYPGETGTTSLVMSQASGAPGGVAVPSTVGTRRHRWHVQAPLLAGWRTPMSTTEPLQRSQGVCAMPKTVHVALKGLSGDFDAAVGPEGMAVHGEIVGTTFDGAPDATTTIFDFPDGPLDIRHRANDCHRREHRLHLDKPVAGSPLAWPASSSGLVDAFSGRAEAIPLARTSASRRLSVRRPKAIVTSSCGSSAATRRSSCTSPLKVGDSPGRIPDTPVSRSGLFERTEHVENPDRVARHDRLGKADREAKTENAFLMSFVADLLVRLVDGLLQVRLTPWMHLDRFVDRRPQDGVTALRMKFSCRMLELEFARCHRRRSAAMAALRASAIASAASTASGGLAQFSGWSSMKFVAMSRSFTVS